MNTSYSYGLLKWHPIKDAPKDGTLILVKGYSGYLTHYTIITTAFYDADFRPKSPWLDNAYNSLEFEPLYYAELTERDLEL